MLDHFKQIVASQYEATLCTLNACLERCPAELWDAPVANLKFCQVAFHTLIFTDLYLGPNPEALREQAFHREREAMFRDYEELEDRPQVLLYTRPDLQEYLQHCRAKAQEAVAAESAESLAAPSGFHWLKASRAETHFYNIRHIQHHAAQLSLRLRLAGGDGAPWFKSGWSETAR